MQVLRQSVLRWVTLGKPVIIRHGWGGKILLVIMDYSDLKIGIGVG